MKSIRTIAISAMAALGVAGAMAQSDTLRLSRQQCVEIAMSESPTIKVADLEVKRMDYSKLETMSSLFPKIDFSTSYQRTIELQTVSMNLGGHSQEFKMGMDNNWNMGFTASMPLVNATLWKAISIGETQIRAAMEDARKSRLDLANNINKAYYAMLLAQASRQVIRDNYDLAKTTADIFAKQFEQGTASEYDVLRSSVQVTNIEPDLLQADIAVRQCELQLKVLMGIDKDVAICPDITLRDMQREMYGYRIENDLDLRNNTTMRTLEIQNKMLKQNLTLKKFAYIPSLAVQYNMNWMAMSNGNALKDQRFNPYSAVALALQVPIFSGTGRYQAVRQAQVQLKELEFSRQDAEHALQMQVELALDNINKQVKQIASSEEGVRMASKAREIMTKSFEIGAASYLNLRDSELADTSAQLAYLQSIYNYLVSSSELDTLLGREEALGINTDKTTTR